MVNTLTPNSIDEIAQIVKDAPGPVVFDAQSAPHPFGLPTVYRQSRLNRGAVTDAIGLENFTAISFQEYSGVIEHDVDDQVVVVRAGTTVTQLQSELAKVNQCLPYAMFEPQLAQATAHFYGSLIDEIGFNLPHGLSAQCGSWRDWVLGMRVVTADGTIAKCGSKAVKNVAGYDVQKLMIGARGTLGLTAEVTLKTFPLKALPKPEMQFFPGAEVKAANWIQRVLPTDFQKAVSAHEPHLIAVDPCSCVLWAAAPGTESLQRFSEDWVVRAGVGERNLEFTDLTVIKLMARAKQLFDPENKLNPGEMGIC